MSSPAEGFTRLLEVLDRMEIPYEVGGSVASSAHGIPRTNRRTFAEIRSFGSEPIECAVATPEDTILRKLQWYRAGGETSERQWNDLRGVLKVSGAKLDFEYMRHWAGFLKVSDLLERLLAE